MFQRLPPAVLPCLLLFGIVCLLYRPSLEYQFIWDDSLFVVKNRAVQSWDYAVPAFTTPKTTWSCDPVHILPAWRPLRNISYLIDHSLYGLNPMGWHLTNILLHGITACLLFGLLSRLVALSGRSPLPWACFAGTLLWAVHPVQTEIVAWVKSRDDLLAAPLIFLSLFLALDRRTQCRIAALIAYAAALLAKDNSIVVAAIFPIILFGLYPVKRPARQDYILVIAFIVVSLLYLYLRQMALGRLAQGGYLAGSASAMALTMFHALTRYIQLTLWPFPPTVQLADYDGYPVIQSLTNPSALTGLIILLALIVVMLASWKRQPLVFIGLALFFIAMLPFANVIPMMQVMAERFLYVPLAGIALLAAALALHNRSTLIGVLILALPLAWSTSRRLPVWSAPVPFFAAIASANPDSWRPTANLVNHLVLEGQSARALDVALKAQARWPGDPDILRPLAIAYMATDQEDQAVSVTQAITRLQPDDTRASDTLAAWRAKFKGR